MSQQEKLVIIGGGPSGLSAAIYASRAQLQPIVVEGNPPGGQLITTSDVENFPGFPDGVSGSELISKLRAQSERFGTRFVMENVANVLKDGDGFFVETNSGNKISTKAVLIATGAEARWLGIPSEQRLRGKGVSACATCDGFFFRGKEIAVIGGGDSALEEALFMTKFATKVYVIHRRDAFRASKIMQKRVLEHPMIEVVWNAQVAEIIGENLVEGIKLTITNQGESSERVIPLQGVFVAIGHAPATGFVKEVGVRMNDVGYILTAEQAAFHHLGEDSMYEDGYRYITSVPGIFAAGDCVDHEYRQAITAAGMGVAAQIEVEKWLGARE